MNEFMIYTSSCSFLFHDLTSLHPPLHFIETFFPLVSLIYHFGAETYAKYDAFGRFLLFHKIPTRIRTWITPPIMCTRAYKWCRFGSPAWRLTIYCRVLTLNSKSIHTPVTVETFGEKISAVTASSKQIVKKMIKKMMTRKK